MGGGQLIQEDYTQNQTIPTIFTKLGMTQHWRVFLGCYRVIAKQLYRIIGAYLICFFTMWESRSSGIRSPVKSEAGAIDKPQTASSQFRSTDRQKFPLWAGRYNKQDAYDLNYEPNYQLIKGKSDLLKNKHPNKSSIDQRMKRLQNMQKWIKDNHDYLQKNRTETSVKERKAAGNSINPQQYKGLLNQKLEVKLEQANKFIPKQLGIFESVETRTIDSRIRSRSDHHLKFDKQVGRQVNVYPVLYNSTLDFNGDKINPKLTSQKSAHPFSSYEQHDVFRPAPISSAVYQWQVADSRVRPQSSRGAINFKLMTKKNVLKVDAYEPPAFTRLAYNAEQAEKMLIKRPPAFKISDTQPREIQFSKQIICDRRGCSR